MRRLVFTAGILVLGASCLARSFDPPAAKGPRSREDEAKAEARLREEEPKIMEHIAAITKELETLDRGALREGDWAKEWAGEYYDGDGLGRNFRIVLAPKSGIACANHGCMGFYGGDHGDIVEALPDGLRVKPILGSDNYGMLDARLYFVRWGERRYLVPESSMLTLVNNCNEGGFARDAMYFIPRLHNKNDPFHRHEAAPAGRPELPTQYAKLLREKPISLKVSKVTPLETRGVTTGVQGFFCTIEFEGGAEQGVYKGLEFWYGKNSLTATTGKVIINRVDGKTCTGELRAFGGKDQTFSSPIVGESVLTDASPVPSVEELTGKKPQTPAPAAAPTTKP